MAKSPVPLAARVVEVIADRGVDLKPRYRYGSGCIVYGRTVLTAAHVVDGARTVWVRGLDKVKLAAHVDPLFVGGGQGPDLALVEIDELEKQGIEILELPAMELAVVDREGPTAEPVERCHAIGFPWFMERPSPETTRDTVDAYGQILVLSRLASGLLTLQVSSSPRPLPPRRSTLENSPWSGMSGAPIVTDGRLVGVVSEHAPREGSSAITATPLSSLEADSNRPSWGPGVANAADWWARLGVPSIAVLRRVPTRRQRPEPAYWSTLRQVHRRTPHLLGRERELADLATFATGQKDYRWLVGGTWAGKTALTAEFVRAALPPLVDVVAYFLSRREADADSNHFLAAVVPQLAHLVNVDPPVPDLHQFRALWEQASEQAIAAGRHLLLVVDGLDEDLHPPGSPSVSALLPEEVGVGAHVLVTSRLHPELPADVRAEHPLRRTRRVQLTTSSYAKDLPDLAKQEIYDLLHRHNADLVADVFGFLAAAAGPLAVSDLSTLIGEAGGWATSRSRLIHRLVTEEAARSLQPIGPADTPRYMFAHDSLLEYAQADAYLKHPGYRQRIHEWARHWREAGWPATDPSDGACRPRYLLDAYPATLTSESRRFAALVSDVAWVYAAIQTTGVNSVLAHLRTARSATPAHKGVAGMLAAVLGQARHLRPEQPVNEVGYFLRQLCLQAIEFSDDGLSTDVRTRLMALSNPGPVPLWSTRWASTALSAELGGLERLVRVVAVLSDGRVACGGSDGRLLVWDPSRVRIAVDELGSHSGMVTAVAVCPGGELISAGEDGWLLLWDPTKPSSPPLHSTYCDSAVTAVVILPGGRIVTGDDSGRILLWDRAQKQPAAELGRHNGAVRAIAVLPDGLIVSAGGEYDGRRMLVLDPLREQKTQTGLGRLDFDVRALAVLLDGRVLSGDDDGRILIWNPARRDRTPVELGRHDSPVEAMAILPDGRIVSGGDDGRVLVWDPSNWRAGPVHLGRHDDWVRAVAALPDGRVVSAGDDRRVRVWEVSFGSATSVPPGWQEERARALAVLPDGRVVSAGDDRRVRVWEFSFGRPTSVSLGRHEERVRALAVLPDGRVVSGGDDGLVLAWNPARAGTEPQLLGRYHEWLAALAVLPDGRVVSAGDNCRVWIWDPSAKQSAPVHLGRHDDRVEALAVLPDGRVVSAGSDGRLLVWEPARPGVAPLVLGRTDDWLRVIAVLSDGRVASGGDDGRVLVWDPAEAGRAPRVIGHHQSTVNALAALPGGRVISSGDDGRMLIWDLSAQGESTCVMCTAVAFVTLPRSAPSECQIVVAHEGGGISGWLVRLPRTRQTQ
jgi:WD40 repeat protein